MNIQVEDISETRKKAVASVTSDEIAAAEKELLGQFTNQAKIKGFRPGKAPANLIKTRYKQELADELKHKVMGDAYKKAIDESKLDVLSVIDVDEVELTADADAEFSFTVDIRPSFEVPDYKGIAVTVPSVEATEEEFQRTLDYVMNQRAEFNEADKAAEKGDYVRLDYTPTLDGAPIEELVEGNPIYGSQTGTWEEAGSEDAPGVRAVVDGIVGMSAGDEKTVEQTFDDDFVVEGLRGKTVQYAIKVHEVREKKLPAIDEAFLKGFGVETEEAFNQRLKDDIRSQKEQRNSNMTREQLMKELTSRVDFALPESAVEGETQSVLREFMARQMQQGATEEQFEEQKEQLFDGASAAARERIKGQLILSEIAQKEKVDVTEQDMQQAIYEQAMQTRTKPEDLIKQLREDRNRVQQLQQNILFGKVLDLIEKEADVTIKEEEPHVHDVDCDHDHAEGEACNHDKK